MIILKILLIILLAVLGLILLVLIMPVGGEVSFIGGKLKFKVKLWILNVMDSEGGGILGWLKKRKSKKKPSKKKKPKPQKKKKSKKDKKKKKPDIVIDTPISDVPVQDAGQTPEQSGAESTSFEENISEGGELTVTGQAESTQTGFYTSGDDADEPEAEAPQDEDSEDTEDKKKKGKKKKEKEKKSLDELVDMLIDIWGSAKNPLCLIFKAFKFSDLYIDFIIANEDAYKCALNYGRISAVTYRGIAQMSRIFTVKLKTVDIQPAFGVKKGKFDAALKLHFRAGTFVIAGLWFLVTYIFRVFIPGKFKKRKAKKSAAVQK